MFQNDMFKIQIDELLRIAGTTREEILEEAKRGNFTDEETRKLFASYVTDLSGKDLSKEGKAPLFDVYLRPEEVPPEFYMARIFGWGSMPVLDSKAVYRQQLHEYFMNLKKSQK